MYIVISVKETIVHFVLFIGVMGVGTVVPNVLYTAINVV